MSGIWFNKIKGIWCADVSHHGVRKRHFFSNNKKDSEREYRRLLKQVWLEDTPDEVEAQRGTTYDKNQVSNLVSKMPPGKEAAHSELTVEKLCDRFLDYYEINRAPGTYQFYKMFLDRLKTFCGKKPAADITPFDIEDIKRHYMKRGCSVTTINDSIRTAKTAYNWALNFDLIKFNPLARVKKLPNPQKRTRFLTEEEEVRLLAAAKGNLRDMIVIYLRTGMRLSELTQMKWSEVDMARGVLTVFKSKTSNTVKHYKPRVIPMHPDVRKILERRKPTKGYIFQSRACKPYDKNSLRKIFDRVRMKANLPDIYIHCLRHTFASRLVLRGVPLTVVAELLGHTDIQTTQMYAHLAPSDLQRAIDKLDNLPV